MTCVCSELGKGPTLTSFVGSAVQVRREDGSVGAVGVSPSSGLLQAHVAVMRWGEAVRLCRHVRDPRLWAALAAMALNARELDTALIAYAGTLALYSVYFVHSSTVNAL